MFTIVSSFLEKNIHSFFLWVSPTLNIKTLHCNVATILDLWYTIQITNFVRGSWEAHFYHVTIPTHMQFLWEKFFKFWPIRQHNWQCNHVEFPHEMKKIMRNRHVTFLSNLVTLVPFLRKRLKYKKKISFNHFCFLNFKYIELTFFTQSK